MDQKIIQGMKEELNRLLRKRPVLEKERFEVLRVVDEAQFITPDLSDEIHSHYNHELARVQADISDIQTNLRRLKGGGSDV